MKKFEIPKIDMAKLERDLIIQAKREVPLDSPFFIENWSAGLRSLSIQTEMMPLSDDRVSDLVAIMNATHDEPHDPWSVPAAFELAQDLSLLVKSVGGVAFIRAGSRSPKDNPTQMNEDCRPVPARNGRQAVEYLSYSERIYLDIGDAKRAGYSPFLCVRRWLDIEWDQEFRCFIEDGKIAGVTQYYLDDGASSWIRKNERAIEFVLRSYLEAAVIPLSKLPSFTCDVVVTKDLRPSVLEINPPVSRGKTFPGLFSDGNLDGSFRVVRS